MAVRRVGRAAKAVVPEPEKGSRTRSPSWEEARRMRSRRATGFWVGCLPWRFSQVSGGFDFPDGFPLLAAIGFLHELVVEGVAGFFVAGGPDDGFGGVGEIAAGEENSRTDLKVGRYRTKRKAKKKSRRKAEKRFERKAARLEDLPCAAGAGLAKARRLHGGREESGWGTIYRAPTGWGNVDMMCGDWGWRGDGIWAEGGAESRGGADWV
jgi:hypothetical protein